MNAAFRRSCCESNDKFEKCERSRSYDIEIEPFTSFERPDLFAKCVSHIHCKPLHDENSSKHKKRAVKMAHEFGPTDSTIRNALQMSNDPVYPLFSNFSASLALQS